MSVLAFPLNAETTNGILNQGMTLRDYFAASVVAAIYKEGVGEITEEEIASDAYRMADAMMAARKEDT